MAKLDAQIAEMEEDVAKSSWHESDAEEERDKKKLEDLKKRKGELTALIQSQSKDAAAMTTIEPGGPEAQTAGAQALGDAAIMQAGAGGGGTEDALASIVENQAQQTKAIVAALAKIDAKASGGGGNGIPMMIPGGDSAGQGGLGRKTVIGAPL